MEDRIRARMQEALDVEPPDASLRQRIMSSLPAHEDAETTGGGGGWSNWGRGVVAGGLAVIIVVVLLSVGAALKSPGLSNRPRSATACAIAPTAPSSAIGNITQYAVPGSPDSVGSVTAGPNCSLWFTAQNAGGTLVMSATAAGFTGFALPGPSKTLEGITTGPDGNIWVTETSSMPGVVSGERLTSGSVSRVTPSGAITGFAGDTSNSSPLGITTGPDGNLWFTDPATNAVVRMTTAGALTVFPIPTPDSEPSSITSGPDGKVWFVERNPGRIATVTMSGTISEFLVPADAVPVAITSGSDGNIWMTQVNRLGFKGPGTVARMTPSGSVTEFPIPISTSGVDYYEPPTPSLITMAPDGNVWFLDGQTVDRLTTAGVFTEYSVATGPGGGTLTGLAAGPDGDIWFTEQLHGQPDLLNKLIPG